MNAAKKCLFTCVLACVFAMCLGLVGCGGSGSAPESSAAESAAQDSQATETDATTDADADATTDTATTITAADLANVDIVIEYGDFDGMKDLSANIQNARSEGSVVQVEGIVTNHGSSCSIVEPSADGTKRIGTVFTIEGADATAYPQDGQRVKITGIVGSDESGYSYFIKTLPDFVEIVG